MVSSPTITMDQKNPKKVCDFAEALVLTGFGKFNILLTVLSGIIAFAIIQETLGFSFVILASQCDLNLSITDKGILAGVPLIGLLSTSQIWGYLADTKGRRRILMISMTLGSICSMLSSLSPNITTLIILKLLSTALMSAGNAVLFAYFGEIMPKTHVDMMISVLSTVFVGSSVAGTGIAWGILSLDFYIPLSFLSIAYRPWRLLIVCFTSFLMIASLGMYFAPESPKYLMNQGRKEEVLQLLKKIYTLNTGKDASTYPVCDILIDEQDKIENTNEKKSVLTSIWDQVTPIFKPPLLLSSFITFVLGFGVLGCLNPFYMWLPDMMDRFFVALENDQADEKAFCEIMNVRKEIVVNIVSPDNNSTQVCDDTFKPNSYPMIMMVSSFITLANVAITIALKWFPKKIILITVISMSCVSVVLLIFVQNYYISWLLMIVFQFSGTTGGIINAYVVELFPTQYRAMAVSFMLLFGRIGGIIGTNVFGWLMEANCYVNFIMFGVVLLLCVLVSFLLPNVQKKKS